MKQRWWLVGLALALLVAVLSPLASPHPDGLERVAQEQGFSGAAQAPWYQLIPDYVLPGVQNEAASKVLSGVLGTALLFGVMWGAGRVITRRRPSSESDRAR